jgi:prepilin-type N-terminal cleavage/methylation domain-containing protein
MRRKRHFFPGGYTFIEIILVVAILGILLLVSYPSIQNTLETRNLENKAREVLTTFQQAKFMAVKYKLKHRVTFDNTQGYWIYFIERENSAGNWLEVPESIRRSIPGKYIVTVNLPNQRVEFTALGTVYNYFLTYTNQHNVSIQSLSLQTKNQPSTRSIIIYAGGSIQYVKST